MKIGFFIVSLALVVSADSDFETKANPDGSVTIAKYVGWMAAT
jgi:hypothetical protein